MTPRQRVNRHAWWKALRASDLPPRARLLAFVLSTWMAADGTKCYPGQDAIADACGWTDPTTVRRATTDLEEAGYLEVHRYGGIRAPGRSQKTHRYWPTIPTDQSGRAARLEPDDQSGSPAREVDATSPAAEPGWSSRPVVQDSRTSPAFQPDQSGSCARQGFQGGELPSLDNPPRARAREADSPPPPTETAGPERGTNKNEPLDHLMRRLGLDIRRPTDELRRNLAACLAGGWTVPLLVKRLDHDRPETIVSPRGWLTDQLGALSRQESPQQRRRRVDAEIAARDQAAAAEDAALAEAERRLDQAARHLDSLPDDERADLEAKARSQFPHPDLVPRKSMLAEVHRLLTGADLEDAHR